MNRDNGPLVTDEPVECKNQPVQVQNLRGITDFFRETYGIYLKSIKKTQKITTCNRLDLETLGSSLNMFKNLPGHCGRTRGRCKFFGLCVGAVNRDCGELIYKAGGGRMVVGWQSEWSRSESDRSTTDHGKQQTWSKILIHSNIVRSDGCEWCAGARGGSDVAHPGWWQC
jgi:hypothetical protein